MFAWFFSATGILGGIGYLLFVVYYCKLLCSRIKDNSKEWILYVGIWALLAITIHGLVDVGITNKEAARLIFLVLGIVLDLRYIEKEELFSIYVILKRKRLYYNPDKLSINFALSVFPCYNIMTYYQ